MPALSHDDVRRLALAIPGVVEQDHHGRPSFRYGGRVLATLWDATHLNVMLEPGRIEVLVGARPSAYAAVWWGRRLAAVRVDLASVTADEVSGLLDEAWHRAGILGRG